MLLQWASTTEHADHCVGLVQSWNQHHLIKTTYGRFDIDDELSITRYI
jgi:hypothetical protein